MSPHLADATPALARCRYDYTGPLHLALLRGHLEVCRLLVDLGGFDPAYENHVFRESLVTLAQDRGVTDIEDLLRDAASDPSRVRTRPDNGKIDFGFDDEETRAFWGEGILAMPAKRCDWPLVTF